MAVSAISSSISFFSSSIFLTSRNPNPKFLSLKTRRPLSNSQTSNTNFPKTLIIRSEVATLPILSFDGEKIGETYLDLKSAPAETARAVVHRGIITDQQNKRRGTASTLTRGEVRGGGIKPYPQKKTGRARRGSQRTPLRPGGGVIFGPKPRDWSIKINRKEKRLALSTALSSAATNTIIVEDFSEKFDKPKTKEFIAAMKRWGIDPKEKSMFLVTEVSDNVRLSSRNIGTLQLLTPRTLNLFDILNSDKLVLTPPAVDYLNRMGEKCGLRNLRRFLSDWTYFWPFAMVNSKDDDVVDGGKIEGSDQVNQVTDEAFEESSVGVSSIEIPTPAFGSTGPLNVSQESSSSGNDARFTERLSDIIGNEGDGDLLFQQNDGGHSVLRWLQALDLQVMGACRADERLKPLLKLNVSSGAAEHRLLAHLIQHFEASEVGMLARCLCIPLVSIRVGKVIKQGTLLCPTATRGNLNLTLLPTSDLRILFVGDDGCTERLATMGSDSESSAVVIEEIPADNSGRSFLIKLPGSRVSYFWCSEKSKLLGVELLSKMKDLLRKKPSLSQLTGISESRLDCFATHLRAYLLGSTSNTQANPVISSLSSLDAASDSPEMGQNTRISAASSKSSRSRFSVSQAAKENSPYQVSLSPRSSSFKEGLPRNMSSIRSGAREKLRRRGDSHLAAVDNLPVASPSTTETSSTSNIENDKLLEVCQSHPLLPLSFLESPEKYSGPSSLSPLSLKLSSSQVPSMGTPLFSPYYCWCPPCSSTLQYTQLPILSTEALSLPPLSSLLSATRSSNSLVPPKLPLNLADIPSLDFPAFLPDAVLRMPFPVPSSQQIPTFTPYMCDPIVHIPVIDVCSSGQGYLVSAGTAISTTIPPLHPNLVNPLSPETESMVEKGARETLRLLISSSQANPQLMEVLPAVLTGTDEKFTLLVAGSRGLYSGTRDVGAIANSIAAMGMVSLPRGTVGGGVGKRCESHDDMGTQSEGFGGSEGSCSLDDKEDSTL
ncbi:hypothetical protein HHK36_018530 [Tetracentron sinense]|uniref:Large ribosomal subunit protein uL4c n=1 Tax=Tetracentron sinense TaxID=13715 RepID=A0A834YZN8_TETSI|nr:hypothetical protein HHK36_018530 [Tetracentron sinense]